MRQVLTGGVEALLTSLNPRRIRRNPPVLEIAMLSGFDRRFPDLVPEYR